MLSFNVVSLFTKIPVRIAKLVIFDHLKCDSELKIRCKLYECFRFMFRQQLFVFVKNFIVKFWCCDGFSYFRHCR